MYSQVVIILIYLIFITHNQDNFFLGKATCHNYGVVNATLHVHVLYVQVPSLSK